MKKKNGYTDDYIQFRASKTLKENVRQAAEKLGIGLSEYARLTLLRQAQKDLEGGSNG